MMHAKSEYSLFNLYLHTLSSNSMFLICLFWSCFVLFFGSTDWKCYLHHVFFHILTDKGWSKLRKRFTVIDSGITRRVWAVNERDMIFKLAKGKWRKVGGRLRHITSGQAGVWGVNRHNNIYYRGKRRWLHVPGKLKQIDSGPRGIVCGVNKIDDIYCRIQIISRYRRGRRWAHISGKLKYISCGEYGYWGVNKANNIYFREGVSRSNPAGLKWRHIPGKLSQLEAGQYGQVWGVMNGNIYVRTGITQQTPWGHGWKRVRTKKKWSRITIGIGTVFGVGKNGRIYRTIPATGGRSQIYGKRKIGCLKLVT